MKTTQGRDTMHILRTGAAAALLLAFAAGAGAQHRGAPPKAAKKLYCWNENGTRVCGDELPPGATDLARTEINAQSGATTGQVARALTASERDAAAEAAREAADAAVAAAEQKRRDLAMVESYATEADLRKAYGERISLLDDALKSATLAESNLRLSLVSLLDQANDLELAGKPIPKKMLDGLRSQHAELVKQQRIAAGQREERAGLDGDLADAIERYRALKGGPAAAPSPGAATPGPQVPTKP
jgi:hypothetical protein